MQQLALDFAKPVPRYNVVIMMVLLLLATLVTAFFVYQQQQIRDEIDHTNQQAAGVGNAGELRARISPELELQMSAAHQIQHMLNTPWGTMLNALEQAQKENQDIKLLSIQPKPEKGEVLITGISPEFDVLVEYINSLRQQHGLGEAVLLNQHWEQSDNVTNEAEQDNLMFNLSVVWLR